MNRPVYLGVMGGPKVGKTHFAGSVFRSKYIDPTRVLYLDNHGSTDPFDFPQYSSTQRYGVRHINPDKPQDLYKVVLDLRNNAWSKGRYPYDAIVVDDWSEFAQAEIEERLAESEDSRTLIRNWGKHGDLMRAAARMLHPAVSHAHHLAIFQAAQLPDPLEKRPKVVENGRVKFTEDIRDTKLRPFLQGSFAAWFPYKLDALWYQYMEVKAGKYLFKMQLTPSAKVAVVSRWLAWWVVDPKLEGVMRDPTFDKVWEMIQRLEPESAVSRPEIETEEQNGNEN